MLLEDKKLRHLENTHFCSKGVRLMLSIYFIRICDICKNIKNKEKIRKIISASNLKIKAPSF